MKIRIVGLAMLAVLPVPAPNQPAADGGFQPSSLNQPGQSTHRSTRNATRASALSRPVPKMFVISLGLGERGGTALAKAEDGAWVGTTEGPMDEGFRYYHLTVDGAPSTIPRTELLRLDAVESGIEILAHDQDFYALMDVPHGRVQQCFSVQAYQQHPRPTGLRLYPAGL